VYTLLWEETVAKPKEIIGQVLCVHFTVPLRPTDWHLPVCRAWGKVGKTDKLASNTNLEAEVVTYVKDEVKGF
jgi:hypothetical protein